VGFARNIAPTAAGRTHPLLRGRRAAYDAPAIHLDAVTRLPCDVTVLAQNAMASVQAAEIRHEGGTFWGVQYHPEFSIRHVAVILERNLPMLINEGFVPDEETGIALLADWFALDMEPGRQDIAWKYGLGRDITDDDQRLTEIQNWLELQVRPAKSARGRA
jgi:GMP synthase (glutamine-hydrolysing)